MRKVCVQLNMVRLSERLARSWGRTPTPVELRQWLADQGFTNVSGSQWYCDGEKIEGLHSDEIIREMYLETENGVTMVDAPRGSNSGQESSPAN